MNNIITLSLKNFINDENIENVKNNYIKLLSSLTITSNISTSDFIKYIDDIYKNGIIYISIIDNTKIIASGTIFLEQKIIRNGQKVGHIEDIVIDPKFRGLSLSSNIINKLIERELAYNVRNAGKMVEAESEESYEILDDNSNGQQ